MLTPLNELKVCLPDVLMHRQQDGGSAKLQVQMARIRLVNVDL